MAAFRTFFLITPGCYLRDCFLSTRIALISRKRTDFLKDLSVFARAQSVRQIRVQKGFKKHSLTEFGQVLTQRRQDAKIPFLFPLRLCAFALKISIESGQRSKGSNLS
jgi:hypothetical protein